MFNYLKLSKKIFYYFKCKNIMKEANIYIKQYNLLYKYNWALFNKYRQNIY